MVRKKKKKMISLLYTTFNTVEDKKRTQTDRPTIMITLLLCYKQTSIINNEFLKLLKIGSMHLFNCENS